MQVLQVLLLPPRNGYAAIGGSLQYIAFGFAFGFAFGLAFGLASFPDSASHCRSLSRKSGFCCIKSAYSGRHRKLLSKHIFDSVSGTVVVRLRTTWNWARRSPHRSGYSWISLMACRSISIVGSFICWRQESSRGTDRSRRFVRPLQVCHRE